MTMHAARAAATAMGLAAVLSVVAAPGPSPSAQERSVDPIPLLEAYARGRHDEALAPAHQATRQTARVLRTQLVTLGSAWVETGGPERPRRALAAAAFALELERSRAERGEWAADGDQDCAGRCVVEWACTVLQSRGPADDAERVWMLASIALAGGVRDWTFLQSPLAPPSERTPEQGHVHHAMGRFPDEPRFRLARAVALASRSVITSERDGPRSGVHTGRTVTGPLVGPANLNGIIGGRRARLAEYARQELESLSADPAVGSEARVRLGYLRWVEGDDAAALAMQREAGASATDPAVKYLAALLAAQAAQALGDLSAAEAHYRSALEARPHSQSATVALAALLYVRGDARDAYELVAASRANRPSDDDPWRLFLYGDFRSLPALVVELRRRLAP